MKVSVPVRRGRGKGYVQMEEVELSAAADREKPPGYVVRAEVFGAVRHFEARSGAEAQALVDRMKTEGVDRQTIRIYVISEWRAPE